MKGILTVSAVSAALLAQSTLPLLAQSGADTRYGYNQGYAGRINCDARGKKTKRCEVRTENRVVLLSRSSPACVEGRTWGYDRRSIWVSRQCGGTFAYGYGNDFGDEGYPGRPPEKDKGSNTGLIVGGVVVAAGLLALLASKKKKSADAAGASETPATYPSGPPAAVSADLASVPAAARPAFSRRRARSAQRAAPNSISTN